MWFLIWFLFRLTRLKTELKTGLNPNKTKTKTFLIRYQPELNYFNSVSYRIKSENLIRFLIFLLEFMQTELKTELKIFLIRKPY